MYCHCEAEGRGNPSICTVIASAIPAVYLSLPAKRGNPGKCTVIARPKAVAISKTTTNGPTPLPRTPPFRCHRQRNPGSLSVIARPKAAAISKTTTNGPTPLPRTPPFSGGARRSMVRTRHVMFNVGSVSFIALHNHPYIAPPNHPVALRPIQPINRRTLADRSTLTSDALPLRQPMPARYTEIV